MSAGYHSAKEKDWKGISSSGIQIFEDIAIPGPNTEAKLLPPFLMLKSSYPNKSQPVNTVSFYAFKNMRYYSPYKCISNQWWKNNSLAEMKKGKEMGADAG